MSWPSTTVVPDARLRGTGSDAVKDSLNDLLRVGRFAPVTAYQRFAYVCGALLVASGLFHAVVFLVDGGPWEGPVSWRKPIVFGLSFGITLMTLAWFMTFLKPRTAVGWTVLGLFSVASLVEVFLVSMQKWRGVASHFNESTPFDGMVFSVMGALVSLLVLLTVLITVRSFFPMDAPPSLAWAIRIGLVLMLVSQSVGVQMITVGGNTFGASGALKVPHAVTLHALQVLPALALLALVFQASEHLRMAVVAVAATGYSCLVAATMVQTYGGHGPLDVGVAMSVFAIVGLVLLALSALTAVGLANPLVAVLSRRAVGQQ
jgi:hypothetical protein